MRWHPWCDMSYLCEVGAAGVCLTCVPTDTQMTGLIIFPIFSATAGNLGSHSQKELCLCVWVRVSERVCLSVCLRQRMRACVCVSVCLSVCSWMNVGLTGCVCVYATQTTGSAPVPAPVRAPRAHAPGCWQKCYLTWNKPHWFPPPACTGGWGSLPAAPLMGWRRSRRWGWRTDSSL